MKTMPLSQLRFDTPLRWRRSLETLLKASQSYEIVISLKDLIAIDLKEKSLRRRLRAFSRKLRTTFLLLRHPNIRIILWEQNHVPNTIPPAIVNLVSARLSQRDLGPVRRTKSLIPSSKIRKLRVILESPKGRHMLYHATHYLQANKPDLSQARIDRWVERKVRPVFPEFQPIARNLLPDFFISGHKGATGLSQNYQMMAEAFLNYKPVVSLSIHTHAPHEVLDVLKQPQFIAREDIAHIGFFLWEFRSLPEAHLKAAEQMDEIWTPSEFVKSIYEETGKSVINVGKALEEQTRRKIDRIKNPHVVMIFDSNSSVERKNPVAGLKGFQRAFPKDAYPSAKMTIKTTEFIPNSWGDPFQQIQRVKDLASKDPRITVIIDQWTQDQINALIDSASAFLSPHRSEGFGYLLARALGRGCPIVASDYGGCQDFLLADYAHLVPAHLVDVPRRAQPLSMPRGIWADPSIDALAEELTRIHADTIAAQKRAAKGAIFVAHKYKKEKFQKTVLSRLGQLTRVDMAA